MNEEPIVEIYTDGGCLGNPGIGGWGAVLSCKGKEKHLSGSEYYTTNNRMEIQAAIGAINAIKRPSKLKIYTDSQYLKNGISEWISGWKRNGWKTQEKTPVKNIDLWKALDKLICTHSIEWEWVKGHAGNTHNEKAHLLADKAMRDLIDRVMNS